MRVRYAVTTRLPIHNSARFLELVENVLLQQEFMLVRYWSRTQIINSLKVQKIEAK